ncbi:MAG: DUF262 domain-containing protein [Rhodothermaceae bacterium]|nr:DUF262 domain-containing protein [Rhodothermaceae bacterium]MYH12915.1 DUF262 domain-containing protein [Rhodothermaceae bacterium]MYJ50973.1 DUF262 domain-containing protein [Rhodothermaceae bacterium]
MEIHEHKIAIGDMIEGYHDDGDGQVIGYAGLLNIRPPYQREYIYDGRKDFQENLIRSIYFDRPVNLIYFAKAEDSAYDYELLDGQQRIITICKFIKERKFAITLAGGEIQYWQGLSAKDQRRSLEYKLHVHVCEGDADELMRWFKTINTGAKELSDQELRNSIYNGPWVTDAKHYFTKKGGQAELCKTYMGGRRDRQDHLERILQWVTGSARDHDIRSYMAKRKKDKDAKRLWTYFREVKGWIDRLFNAHRAMKQVNWGVLHRKYGDREYDAEHTRTVATKLMNDDEVQKKSGVYEYVLGGQVTESLLNLRTFDDKVKFKVYAKQDGKCNRCGAEIKKHEAHADHIKPWSKGGKTDEENCQVLCAPCNLHKGARG